MLFKILREYIRRITRNYKIYAVSILGMSIAIIASFHMYHFVYKELSVDSFHTKRKDIYRLVAKYPNSSTRSVQTYPSLGGLLKDNLPEINDFTRIVPNSIIYLIIDGNKHDEEVLFADPSFFDIFDFKLKQGDVSKFKENINGVVISEKKAKELFGNRNPLGDFIEINRNGNPENEKLEIVGIMENIPENSTIQTDFVLNISKDNVVHYTTINEKAKWSITFTHLYVYAPTITDTKKFTNRVTDVLFEEFKKARGDGANLNKANFQYDAQRLDTIYFDSADVTNQTKIGSRQFVNILILVGFLTLLLAVFNYILMNLGLNLNRVKEFKTKRYLGASKFNIYVQLLLESLINVLICFALTLFTYPVLNEFIKSLIGFDYNLSVWHDKTLLLSYLLIIICIGFITGTLEFMLSYKAIFKTDEEKGINWTHSWISKKVMVGFQLFLFIGLTICILFVKKQINYIETKDLGFDSENVATISPYGFNEVVINELESKSYVNAISIGDVLYQYSSFILEDVKIKDSQNEVQAMVIRGDTNYLKTYNLKLLQGRNIKSSKPPKYSSFIQVGGSIEKTNDLIEVLVSEAFVNKANLKNPLGTVFESNNINNAVIVGVFKDIHNTSLYTPIKPVVIGFGFNSLPIGVFQISYDKTYEKDLKSFLKDLYLENGMTYFDRIEDNLLSKIDFKDIYKKELQLKRLLEAFTVIVLFICLLGMIAISLFITESKTKEIGIRKVNGATIKEIMLMLNKDFVKWVLIAFIIAIPITYYIMSKWLENFAYKTNLSWWVFALAGMFTLIVSLLTVSWQTYKAASKNPVESLRDE